MVKILPVLSNYCSWQTSVPVLPYLMQKDLPTYCHQGMQKCSNFFYSFLKKPRLFYSLSLLFLLLPAKRQENSWELKFQGSRNLRRILHQDWEGCVSSLFPLPAPALQHPGSRALLADAAPADAITPKYSVWLPLQAVSSITSSCHFSQRWVSPKSCRERGVGLGRIGSQPP